MREEPAATSDGLHAPGGALGALEPPRRWSPARMAMQLIGGLLALGLLGWALSLALSDDNRASLENLSSAEPWRIISLFALSALAVVLSGLMFWVVIRPERPVPLASVMGANAIAMGLGLVPLKLGMVARVLIHHRRDGVPFKDIVAWVAAMAALSVAILGPLALACLWRGDIDPLWWLVGVGGALAASAAGVAVGGASASRPWLARMSLGSWRLVRHPVGVGTHAALRLTDLGLLGLRFWLAATMAGVAMSPGHAMLYAVVYVTMVVGGPVGRVGFAEMAVAGVAAAVGQKPSDLALVAITVTAVEALTSLGAAAIACFWIRPDRLMARRVSAPSASA